MEEIRARQSALDRVAARRAGQPRRLKTIEPTALRMLRLAADLRAQGARGGATPSEETILALAAFKAPVTWNRYLPTLRGWEQYAAGKNTPFLPADPGHFANFLTEAAKGAVGSTQSKQRSCAIQALSTVAGVASPTGDDVVKLVRAGLRRRLRGGRRGSSRPIFPHEVPATPGSPPAARGRGIGARRPLSVRRRARAQATRHMSLMSAASLRYDDAFEGQLGDICWFRDSADLSLFGTKTDHLLRGQAAVIPASHAPASGFQAALEGARLGLQRLLALPADTVRALAASFTERLSVQERGSGPAELAAWPQEIRDLAAPLYELGVPVHCLPLLGEWQYERLTAASDLGAPMARSEFVCTSRQVLGELGVDVTHVGAHSFRRGSAGALFHAGLGPDTVSTALRHRSSQATAAYVSDAARMAALANAIAPSRPDGVAGDGGVPSRLEPGPDIGRRRAPGLAPPRVGGPAPRPPARPAGRGGPGGPGAPSAGGRGGSGWAAAHLAPRGAVHPQLLGGRAGPPLPEPRHPLLPHTVRALGHGATGDPLRHRPGGR